MRGEHQIVGEGGRERLTTVVIDELLRQRAAEPLSEAADELAFDQLRIDRAADVVGNRVALDLDAPGGAVDGDNRSMDAVRIGHVRGDELAFGGELAIEPVRELAERE